MVSYKILVKETLEKDLKAIPKKDVKRIYQRIGQLALEPRPHSSEKLSSQERYRIRQGNYRILYSIEDELLTVWIVKVGDRTDIYR